MLMRLTFLNIAIVSVIAVTTAVPAHATLYCEIANSSDGFAALRAAPDRKARLVMKLTQSHMVLIDDTKQPPANANAWVGVSAVPSDDPRHILARGWLHKSLIKPDSCG